MRKFYKLFILISSIRYALSLCPDPEVLNPCKCLDIGIICKGNEILNLKQVFQTLSRVMAKNEKHFKGFELMQTNLEELEENTFYDITFDEIMISFNKHLRHINTKAFGVTSNMTTKLVVFETPVENSAPNHDFFQALNTMRSLKEINFKDLNITEIPANAFRPAVGFLNNLTSLSMKGFKKLRSDLLFELNNLEVIDLSNGEFKTIPTNAFRFKTPSNKTLRIGLQENNLNSSGFETGSFNDIKRPTILDLSKNKAITYLDEKIFRPFLESNPKNTIELFNFDGVENIDCNDCENYWLRKYPEINDRNLFKKCSNGQNFKDSTNFAKCE